MPRLLPWLFIVIIAVFVVGALVLMFVDVPHQPTRVEQPVPNETLGL